MAFQFYITNEYLNKVLTVASITDDNNKLFQYLGTTIDSADLTDDSGYIWVSGETPIGVATGVTILNAKSQGFFGKTGDIVKRKDGKTVESKIGSVTFIPEINIDKIVFTEVQTALTNYYINIYKDGAKTTEYLVYDAEEDSVSFIDITDVTTKNADFFLMWKLIPVTVDVPSKA